MENKMDATIRAILEGYFGEGSVEDVIDDLHREIYKAGVRKVVEWIKDTGLLTSSRFVMDNLWQAKLKEWGIEG